MSILLLINWFTNIEDLLIHGSIDQIPVECLGSSGKLGKGELLGPLGSTAQRPSGHKWRWSWSERMTQGSVDVPCRDVRDEDSGSEERIPAPRRGLSASQRKNVRDVPSFWKAPTGKEQ